MIVLLSPSKTLSKRAAPECNATEPQFLAQASELVDIVNKLGSGLAKTLGVSDKIAEINRQRFAEWDAIGHKHGKPAIYAYAGDVYNGLAAFDMTDTEISYAQDHLRILSGLYGSLRPLDNILPYRLEMSTRLAGSWGANLYKFWGDEISNSILSNKPKFILNCASNEYSKAVLQSIPEDLQVVTPKFLHDSGSGLRAKMTFAKYTRGLMARWAIENQIQSSEELLKFNAEGYQYKSDLSQPDEPVFVAPKDFSLLGRFKKF